MVHANSDERAARELTREQEAIIMAPIHARGDRLMTLFIGIHALLALALASQYGTWFSTLVLAGSAVAMFNLSRWLAPGTLLTRCIAGIALQMFVALHIHQMHGLYEMHFWFFTASTMMIIYQDWRCMWPGTIAIIAHHIIASYLQQDARLDVGFLEDGVFFDIYRQFWHYGIVIFEAGICGYWAGQLREQTLRNAVREEALRQARNQAEDANRAKGEFLANISHELRTPLGAVIGLTSILLEDEAELSDRQREDLGTIQRNGEHLMTVINDLLDLTKIDHGMFSVESIEVPPLQVMVDVLASMRGRAQAKGIELRAAAEGSFPESIRTDPTRLRQILLNLLSNAVKFTERGWVEFRASYDPGRRSLSFTVADTGIGMSPEQLELIFQPFIQGDGSMARRFGGTGLGLAVSRRLAELLGGALAVRSEPGHGSTFVLALPAEANPDSPLVLGVLEASPVREEGPAAVPVIPRAAPAPPEHRRLRVLVAEDMPENQRILSHFLRPVAEVQLAKDGEEALRALSDSRAAGPMIDIVLMDMCMPMVDGFEAVRRMRERGDATPVIALTAFAMAEERARCLAAGCDDYLSKPIKSEVLVKKVCDLAQARGIFPEEPGGPRPGAARSTPSVAFRPLAR